MPSLFADRGTDDGGLPVMTSVVATRADSGDSDDSDAADVAVHAADMARMERLEQDRKMLRLFQVVVGELRDLLNAHRGTLFIVDNSTKTMWSTVSGGRGRESGQDEVPIRIRINWIDGICGFVRHTRLLMNVPDAYRCKYFNRSVDAQTGYRTKSVLCCAICHPLNRRQVLAVVELLNKIDRRTKGPVPFDKEDEQLMLKFGRRLEQALKGTPVEKPGRF